MTLSKLFNGKTIFIAPLDWGMGHATRCVPIIQSLCKENIVIIGVTDLNRGFFNEHFHQLQKAELPSYNISYSKYLPFWLKLLLQSPKIYSVIKRENKQLKEIILTRKIDLVISDNRYGLWSKDLHCIFITHQLNLKTPFFSGFANHINRNYIHKFNEVWVPDYQEEGYRLSGHLSDSGNIKIPVKYIGPQSALTNLIPLKTTSEKFDHLILLSGIEPQRSILEKLLLKKFKTSEKKIILVRGSGAYLQNRNVNMKIIDFAFGQELRELIVNAETVICRSGYSTLMDLHLLDKKKLILIPTPGQTEQEYLADFWKENFGSKKILQKELKS